jgi:hypothetical protein
MAFSDDYALMNSAGFQQQVQMALIKAAGTIAIEAYSSKSAYTKRHNLAVSVLINPTTYVPQFAGAIIQSGNLTTGATDAQVLTQISAIWNIMSGVSAADTQ